MTLAASDDEMCLGLPDMRVDREIAFDGGPGARR